MKPPIAEKKAKELTIHGHTRIDNYFWLKERDNPEVIDYLKAENEYTEAIMKDTEKLQEKLYNEIIGQIKQTDESVPYMGRLFAQGGSAGGLLVGAVVNIRPDLYERTLIEDNFWEIVLAPAFR